MPTKADVAAKAKEFVESGSYTYKQVRDADDKNWKNDTYMDCSEFVYQAYQKAGYTSFSATNTSMIKAAMTKTTTPVNGDVVSWPGHVGIITNAATGEFHHAASTKSGLRVDNYKSGYWSTHGGMEFYSYDK